jgi:hypothetical protein
MSSFPESEKINDDDIKEDFLEVDPKIPGQNFACISFVSPEKVLKQKEVFFTTKFLEHFFNSDDQYTKDTRENLMKGELKFDYSTIKDFYEDWKYSRNDMLDDEFYKMNDYRTTIRGLKVRGVYDTHKEANVRAQLLRRKDPTFNVFVGQVGYWLPWDPECEQVPEQEYQEDMLNDLVKKYKDNLESKDDMYEKLKEERVRKAKEEVAAKKEQLRQENVAVQETREEDVKNIEKLRDIVDESDKLWYDNLKKTEAAKKEAEKNQLSSEKEEAISENIETVINDSESNEKEEVKIEEVNNFKSENMEALENDDPWLKRKMEKSD